MEDRRMGRYGLEAPAQPGIASAIIGSSKPEQLDANLAALNVTFYEELTAACDAVWWSLPRRPVREGYR